jgi:sn-glycerol 3-phosphate transport system substrate-binding protein
MIMLWCILASLLAACGGAAPATAPSTTPAASSTAPAAPAAQATAPAAAPSAAPAAGTVSIDFYYPVAVAGPITKIIDGYVAEFEQQNPTIKVNAVLAGGYADALTKIQTTIQGGGKPPALAVLLSTDMQTLIDADAIMPVDDLIKQSGGDAYQSDFFPAFLLNSQAGGKTWGIPFQRSTPVLYYNKDLFKKAGLDPEKAPASWDDLAAACSKLTTRDSGGAVSQWGIEIPSDGFPYWLFQGFAISAGQNVVGDDAAKVSFNTPEALSGLKYWIDLVKTKQCQPEGVIKWATTPNDFTAGKAAMIYHTTGSLTNILNTAKFDVGVAFLPANKTYGAPTGGGNLYMFKDAPADQQAAAWKFIQFLTSPEKAADWSIQTGYIATRASAYDTQALKDYLAKRPQAAVARDQLQYASKELTTHNSAQVQQIFGKNIQAALTGDKTPEQALQDAQTEAEKLLAQFK